MIKNTASGLLAVSLLASLLFAGCTVSVQPDGDFTPTVRVTGSAHLDGTGGSTDAPLSPATTASSDQPAASTSVTGALQVSTGGIGPIEIGKPIAASNDVVAWSATACPDSGTGLWVPNGLQAGLSPSAPGYGVLTAGGEQNGAVTLIQVTSPAILTPSGLHVGSAEAQVRAALPKLKVKTDSAANAAYVSTSAGLGRITLTLANSDGSYVAGGANTVRLITVSLASASDSSYWGTDVGAHCPA